MSADFQGQHAVVTGGGSGIGAAIADALQRQGAAVTLLGRGEGRLAATAEKLGVQYVVADITLAADVQQAFGQAVGRQGTVSILVNNAGAAEARPFHKMDGDFWQFMLGVNLTGVFHCTRAVIDGMSAARYGRIINIASTAAQRGYAYVSAYSAAKHGVIGLTRSLALEYARKGITVNAVCPGYTDTDIVANSVQNIMQATGRSSEEALAELVKSNPQGRLVTPEEVADTVLWLCRKQSSSVTGQSISIAGGEVM
ncbi:MAG TPA: SDR family NAD(P)-dependent oxidoreductase [Xanthomonadales bacterium]|nr:SDR family NAD(P)-dependent oxidoreductase [Xanthomonadales bacterium]